MLRYHMYQPVRGRPFILLLFVSFCDMQVRCCSIEKVIRYNVAQGMPCRLRLLYFGTFREENVSSKGVSFWIDVRLPSYMKCSFSYMFLCSPSLCSSVLWLCSCDFIRHCGYVLVLCDLCCYKIYVLMLCALHCCKSYTGTTIRRPTILDE